MAQDRWRHGAGPPRELQDLAAAPGRRPPRWAVLSVVYGLGLLSMLSVLLLSGALGADDDREAAVAAAYDAGHRDGAAAARAAAAGELDRAAASAYVRGLADGDRLAAQESIKPFSVSPFLAFAVPLANLDRELLEACPLGVPLWFVRLHGVEGCAEP